MAENALWRQRRIEIYRQSIRIVGQAKPTTSVSNPQKSRTPTNRTYSFQIFIDIS